jgi:hypothetical protein
MVFVSMSKSVSAFLFAVFLILHPLATQSQTTWISGVSILTTSTAATVSWTTPVPTTTQVRYGLTTSYGSHTTLNTALTTAHAASLIGLAPGTVYQIQLLDKDAEPLLLTSKGYTMTTQAGPVTVALLPATVTVASGGSQQFTAQVTNATDPAVNWSASIGSITAGGMFTAPAVTVDQNATIIATSVADPSKSATAVVTVKAPIVHSVSLSWQASSSNGIAFYSAYRSSAHGGPYGLIGSAITGLAYSDPTVQAGTTYYYVLTATDDQGQESVDSNEVAASVPSP